MGNRFAPRIKRSAKAGKRLAAQSRRLIPRAVLLVLLACALTFTTYAWFLLGKKTRTDDVEVIMPPIIYIRDEDRAVMESFNLDGLQINEEYYALFCVAPAYEDVVDEYDVGVIYTENIGMVIDLFPVKSITASVQAGMDYQERMLKLNSGDKTAEQCFFNYIENTDAPAENKAKVTYTNENSENDKTLEKYLNRGVRKMYHGEFLEPTIQDGSELIKELNNTKSYKFYVLRVTWKDMISEAELEKETDAVYIVTKGGTKHSAPSGTGGSEAVG